MSNASSRASSRASSGASSCAPYALFFVLALSTAGCGLNQPDSLQASTEQSIALPVVVATSLVTMQRTDSALPQPPSVGAMVAVLNGTGILTVEVSSPLPGVSVRGIAVNANRWKVIIYGTAAGGIPEGALFRVGFSNTTSPSSLTVTSEQAVDFTSLASLSAAPTMMRFTSQVDPLP